MADTKPATDLVEFIAKALVNEPEEIRAIAADDGVIELETAAEDRGRVIGRQGRVAKAMRALLAASNTASDWQLEIVD